MRKSRVKSAKPKRRFTLIYALVSGLAVSLLLLVWNLFGDNGILANLRLEREHQALSAEKAQLEAENLRLMAEIKALQTNPRKIEEVAREDLGLGRPGEIIFVFPENQDAPVKLYRHPQE